MMEVHGYDHPQEHGSRYFFGIVPVFLVDDVAASEEYYRDVLGFDIDDLWGEEEPVRGRVVRDDVIIDFLGCEPPGMRNSMAVAGVAEGTDAVIVVADIEDVYVEMQEKGASVLERLATRESGMLDFTIEDLNGYRLTLSGDFDDEEG